MVERFHVGQRVRLKRTLASGPWGKFQRGATGTVTAVEGIMVWMKLDLSLLRTDQDIAAATFSPLRHRQVCETLAAINA